MPAPLLQVEALEPRDVPATFGTPWPDGERVTLSFAPDGALIGSSASDLFAELGPDARLAVLRAFQAWAVHANVNIGLVPDSGAAFGTGGAIQGDPRFGDVRVGGRALAGDVLAITAPYNLYDNYSGDLVVNTAAPFGLSGYDLYTALLQESGHALGVGNSPDAASVMYEFYSGVRTGLSAGDIASIQALYGARQPDQYEGLGGNDTLAAATRYRSDVTADLTTTGDVDVYKFTAGVLTQSVTVSLRAAGLSLLTARVEVLDASGRVLASRAVTDPLANDITLSLGGLRAGTTYYVRVSGAGGEFGIGSYALQIKQSSLLTQVTDVVGNLLEETGLNDTLFTATSLLSKTLSPGPQTEYGTRAAFGSPADADYYRLTVPGSVSNGPVNLLITVWGADGQVLNPWIEVRDATGGVFAAQVTSANGNTTTLQVTGLKAGATYFVKTFSDSGSVGEYTFAADVRPDVVTVPELASGTVGAATAATTEFSLEQTSQVHLVLSATGARGTAEAVITNEAGDVVGRFTAAAGRGRSLDLYLAAGKYTVTVRSVGGDTLGFQLGLAIVTDPVGAQPEDPTGTPAPTTPPPPTSPPVPPPSEPTTPTNPTPPPPSEPPPPLPPDPEDPAQWD